MRVIEKKDIGLITEFLKADRVVALPTDTVYGFFANGRKPLPVNRIFEMKKRPRKKPLGIFVSGLEMAESYAVIGKKEERMARKYWPGKITFVLEKRKAFPKGVGTETTIGIRVPDYSLFEQIFKGVDFPLAQTSANISGQPSVLNSQKVIDQFKNRAAQPDLVLDSGRLPEGKPSTVIDLTGATPRVLRKGEVEAEAE